jgi:hypothetical protein
MANEFVRTQDLWPLSQTHKRDEIGPSTAVIGPIGGELSLYMAPDVAAQTFDPNVLAYFISRQIPGSYVVQDFDGVTPILVAPHGTNPIVPPGAYYINQPGLSPNDASHLYLRMGQAIRDAGPGAGIDLMLEVLDGAPIIGPGIAVLGDLMGDELNGAWREYVTALEDQAYELYQRAASKGGYLVNIEDLVRPPRSGLAWAPAGPAAVTRIDPLTGARLPRDAGTIAFPPNASPGGASQRSHLAASGPLDLRASTPADPSGEFRRDSALVPSTAFRFP